jgi:hypothetical protein
VAIAAESELRQLVELIGAKLEAQAEVMTGLLREFFAHTPATQSRERGQSMHVLVGDIVRRGQERGEIQKSLDPRLCVALFLSTSAAILAGNVWQTGEITPEAAREQFYSVVFHGLKGDIQ